MRTLLSTLSGLALVVGLFVLGGAVSPVEEPEAAPFSAPRPLPFETPFTGPAHVTEATPTPGPSSIDVPDPLAGESRVAWFGCQPPLADAVCGPLAGPMGVESLIPEDPTSPEDWRPLVAAFFAPDDVERALDVMQCESFGNPDAKNPRSTASGLFQHLASMWPPRAAAAGFAGADVFEPVANVGTAAWLVYEGGGWSHWYPSRHCWGR